ncbi:DNA damage-inducible protein 1 [Pseudogymnoascus destructans]|uniref:DNA damage-inducible protein 1 n=1 Tax=Pseudogymnoascus destructans TaxID=655981 RepID=A0A177AK67_9PEZI|nr:DNA damage-inducible protein 1 [Pseudogymnoascus destructans]OAF61564.1 DNA damage-inducible protein 1 [Pseudogymnoascus destructans]
MRLTLNIASEESLEQDLLNLEVPTQTTVGSLKGMVQAEAHIPTTSQHIYHNGQLLSDDNKTLEQLQVVDGDMLALHVRDIIGNTGVPQPGQAQQPARRPAASQNEQDPEVIRLQLLGNPRMRQEVQRAQPELAAAVENPQRFAQLFRQMQDQERRERMMRQQHLADLNADPFDIDAQTRIAEMIREERVQENLQNAIEHNPEVFGRVHMLYIDVEVNGHKVKAFVDSGAQATIMSPSCAESCGIMRLVDKRFAGIARGVGTANILGRVHSAQIKIGSLFLPCSFTVMEGKDVDLLLGLDMLKRHQACIDLSKDKLVIQDVEVPFLGEADIPRSFEEVREPTVEGPGGTTIGGRSGAISGPAGPATANTPTAPAAQAAATPQPQPPVQPPQAAPASAPSAESIDQLVALGFSREEAVNALNACDGNVEFAAGLLFQG